MYYLNKDGSIDHGSGKENFENNPIEVIAISSTNDITGEMDSQDELHRKRCKCMKCFVKNKIGSNVTYSNAIMVIIFLIFIYLVYLVLIRLFY